MQISEFSSDIYVIIYLAAKVKSRQTNSRIRKTQVLSGRDLSRSKVKKKKMKKILVKKEGLGD